MLSEVGSTRVPFVTLPFPLDHKGRSWIQVLCLQAQCPQVPKYMLLILGSPSSSLFQLHVPVALRRLPPGLLSFIPPQLLLLPKIWLVLGLPVVCSSSSFQQEQLVSGTLLSFTSALTTAQQVSQLTVNNGVDIVILKQDYVYCRIKQRSKYINFVGIQASRSERKELQI